MTSANSDFCHASGGSDRRKGAGRGKADSGDGGSFGETTGDAATIVERMNGVSLNPQSGDPTQTGSSTLETK